jgi:hypothetical protein
VSDLVGDSGGRIYRIATPSEVDKAADDLVEELRNQLSIAYMPSNPFDGKYRKLKVEAKPRGVSLRHRGGYLAMPMGSP